MTMNAGLWKYFTSDHHREYICSLHLLGDINLPPQEQLRCLYALARHTDRHYTKHTILKPSGGVRRILAPDQLLKAVQRNILRHVLSELPVSPHAIAYRPGGSALQGAVCHRGRNTVLHMDICDFFDSVTYLMVYRSAFPRAYYPPPAATLLANLCCYHDYLPQGAPTSAAISNLVMKPFDDYMATWCAAGEITYTRYCDDMSFSGDFDPAPVIAKVRSFLLSMGFEVNDGKTRIMRCSQRQMVTGIVVNEKPQVTRAYRDRLRQEVYYCKRFGAQSHLHRQQGGKLPTPEQTVRYLRSLLGKVGYVLQIDPQNERFLQARNEIAEMLFQTGGCPPDSVQA